MVAGCEGWPFTITGLPAASADMVSPPNVPKAKGKLDAPNTAMGPIGLSILRKSGLGKGARSGSAVSILACTQLAFFTISAKAFI